MRAKEKLPSSVLAGEEGSLTQIAERYASARLLTNKIALALPVCNEEQQKLQHQVKECWSWWVARHYPQHLNLSSVTKAIQGFSCKRYKLCAVCAIRRSVKVWHSIEAKVSALGFAPTDLALVTITMQSHNDLSQALQALRSFYQTLRQGRNNHEKRGGSLDVTPWAALDGWIGHMEITKTESGWHPHYHFLVAPKQECKHLFVFDRLPHGLDDGKKGFWNSQFTSMIGRKLYAADGVSYIAHTQILDDLGKGIAEVAKYLFKFGGMEPADVVHAHFQTRRMRLGCSGGCFHGLSLEPDELLDSEGLEGSRPFLDYLMSWDGSGYVREALGGLGMAC
jgi:hypothetical protein